jgi:hypothetical protein
MFTLKTPTKEFTEGYERAKNILISALVNKADISLVSDTHYFDKDCKDILLIANNENLNEKPTGDTGKVFKPKSRNKI